MQMDQRAIHLSIVVSILLEVLSGTVAQADSLVAAIPASSLELYEPIVLDLTLELSTPYVYGADPVEATGQLRRIKHRLVAELREGDETLCSALLYGGQFAPLRDQQTEFHATVVGCLGIKRRNAARTECVFWDRPGNYILVVRDRDSALMSNAIAITITEPEERKPAHLFQTGGVDTLSLVLVQPYGENAVPTFRTLAAKYPGTVYGKYARLALALRRAEALRSRRVKAAPGTYPGLAKDLKEASTLFEPGHPLRSRALWHLARTQRSPSVLGDPKETIRQLLTETHDGQMIREARDFLKEMARRGDETGGTVRGESQD